MLKQLSDNVWKINIDSNVYVLLINEEYIVVDCGPKRFRKELEEDLKKVVDPAKVSKVIMTHFHYDHLGNFDLFPNAEFYASKEAIEDFENNNYNSVLDEGLKVGIKFKLLTDSVVEEIKVISTPGHTRGSVCLYYAEQKMLFTGDTFFGEGSYGRTDLPTSVPDKLAESVREIRKLDYEILCPGHDYV